MLIQGTRIKSLERHFAAVAPGTKIVMAVTDITRFAPKLAEVGFTTSLNPGESVLPPAHFGPVSHRNAEGWVIIHKDRPKETAYRTVEWHWRQWRGRHDYEDCSKLVNVPYKRYPRTQVPPPSIEFKILTATAENKIVAIEAVVFSAGQAENLLHCVNLFLEIFGECEVLTLNLNEIVNVPIRRLNWDIFPPGNHPWATVKARLNPIIQGQPKGNQGLITNRLEAINGFGSEFLAVGRAGFSGYVIFGFPKRKLFVLESIHHGNATYVFGEDWEQLSKLTKGEILTNGLQKLRIIHRAEWIQEIRKLLA
jgi:hypothetical protein